jgi:metal-responsive CopG/Arc/MetJ family transcriptional regulator
MQSKVTIKIPQVLYQKLKAVIAGTGFSSVSEFIIFVLRNVTSGGEIETEDRLTADEIRAVRERLKKLGYLQEEK